MGAIHVTVTIRNPADPSKFWEGLFLVDTGATDSLVPKSHLEAIGLESKGLRVYETADGRKIKVDVTTADIEFMGDFTAGRIIMGDEDAEPLLGVTALESAGIEIDPVNQRLKKLPALRLKRLHARMRDESPAGSGGRVAKSIPRRKTAAGGPEPAAGSARHGASGGHPVHEAALRPLVVAGRDVLHHTVVPDDEIAHLPAMPAPEPEPRRCEATTAEGLGEQVEQIAGYMDHDAAGAGPPVVIDQREGRDWEEKVFDRERRSKGGAPVEVRSM